MILVFFLFFNVFKKYFAKQNDSPLNGDKELYTIFQMITVFEIKCKGTKKIED
jgi:hypothetical protein